MNSTALIGFFDELSKISADLRTDIRRSTDVDPVEAAKVVGAGGAMGGGILGSMALGRNLQSTEAGGRTTPADVARLRRAIGGEGHLLEHGDIGQAVHVPKGGVLPEVLHGIEKGQYKNMGIPKEVVERGLKRGVSVMPGQAGPHVGAHELGHGRWGASGIGKILRVTKARNAAPLFVGTAGTIMSGLDPDSTASKLAPVASAASLAPMLTDEAAASIHAIRGMRRAGYSAAQIAKGKKQLLKAFGTYALGMGVPTVAAPVLARHMRKSVQHLVPGAAEANA